MARRLSGDGAFGRPSVRGLTVLYPGVVGVRDYGTRYTEHKTIG